MELQVALRVWHTVGKGTQQQGSNKYSNMGFNSENSIVSAIRHQTSINSLCIIIVWIINFGSWTGRQFKTTHLEHTDKKKKPNI